MEWVMHQVIPSRVRGVNQKLRAALGKIADALAGRGNFAVEDVRAIAEPVREMASLVCEADRLRAGEPDLRSELETYARNLEELQTGLDRIRCVLLARCAQMEAQRGHMQTVRLWATTWQQTR